MITSQDVSDAETHWLAAVKVVEEAMQSQRHHLLARHAFVEGKKNTGSTLLEALVAFNEEDDRIREVVESRFKEMLKASACAGHLRLEFHRQEPA